MAESKVNYAIIIDHDNWKYITDGYRVYEASHDIRYSSDTPHKWDEKNFIEGFGSISKDTEFNKLWKKFNKVELLPQSFDEFVINKNIDRSKIIRPPNFFSKLEKTLNYSTFLCSLGYLFTMNIKGFEFDPGYFGIVGGLLLSGILSSKSEFSHTNMQTIFNHVSNSAHNWVAFNSNIEKLVSSAKESYLETAKKEWNKYFRIKNILYLAETIDFDKMNGWEFELFLKDLYERKGYVVELKSTSSDFGIDLLATKSGEKLGIQAKRYNSTVGVSAIQEVVAGAKYYNASKSVVITNSMFSKNAISLAERNNVQLIDKENLMKLVYSVEVTKFENDTFSLDRYEKLKDEIKKFLLYKTKSLKRRRRFF